MNVEKGSLVPATASANMCQPSYGEVCAGDLEIVGRDPDVQGFAAQPWRWVVNRRFAWLVRNRRLWLDHERSNILSKSGRPS